MDEIILMRPDERFSEDIWAFRQELIDAADSDSFAGCNRLRDCASAAEWCEWVRFTAENCPADKVPSDTYIAVRQNDRRIVGVIDLRHHIDHPILGLWGGHIGYIVRPDERGKGYAKEMLRLDLANARALGLEKVMVTCDDGNLASERTIIACGGVYEKSVFVIDHMVKRFWIEL